jgi:hypothetical protein
MKSDAQLKLDVMSELAWDPSITTPRIGVAVRDGVVILTGRLEDHADKHAVERAVRRVAGDVKLVYVVSAGAGSWNSIGHAGQSTTVLTRVAGRTRGISRAQQVPAGAARSAADSLRATLHSWVRRSAGPGGGS